MLDWLTSMMVRWVRMAWGMVWAHFTMQMAQSMRGNGRIEKRMVSAASPKLMEEFMRVSCRMDICFARPATSKGKCMMVSKGHFLIIYCCRNWIKMKNSTIFYCNRSKTMAGTNNSELYHRVCRAHWSKNSTATSPIQ